VQEHHWDAPPPELDEVSRHGFHDGVEGARKDYGNHRRPDVNNREEYRHPSLPERDREAYRRGFERGYQAGVDHLYHGRV
jgi:ribosome modulation factor